jgi:phosphoribosylformylglycinamidine synthase
MKKLNVSILQFPGTNCDYDTVYAFSRLGHNTSIVWHKEESLPENTELVVVPGGFSYGDYLRCGAIARFSPIMKVLREYAENGGMVLGICNGFQILTEAGLLPGALKRNDKLHFISRHQHLKVVSCKNAFLNRFKEGDIINIPIAHHDGNYYVDEETLSDMEQNAQILLRYCDEDGKEMNVNGSVRHIAGICNREKNVYGLMPHPERAMESILGSSDGERMLEGFRYE